MRNPDPVGLPVRALFIALIPISACGPSTGDSSFRDATDFTLLATVDVGENPHQIAFDTVANRVYIAAAGSDRITVVHPTRFDVEGTIPFSGVPLGLAVLPSGGLLVSAFQAEYVQRIVGDSSGSNPESGSGVGNAPNRIVTGVGSSLFHGPIPGAGPVPDGSFLVSTERENRLWLISGDPFAEVTSFETGSRPFPPAATADGRLAFVPNYDDGTVTVVDLWNERVAATTPVGERPSGGVVLPDGVDYAVAVRGENRIAFINTASWEVTDTLRTGIGESPFSIVLTPNGRLGFVNNTESHDVSVMDVEARRIIARIPVGEIPISLAVSPDGSTLWVAAEGSDVVQVISIPEFWWNLGSDADEPRLVTEVAVLGMIHGSHRSSDLWGSDTVRETIRAIDPDVVCIEIPPNRWDRIWADFSERGAFDDLRVRPFPEYVDVLLPLTREMDFEVEPCAAWTKEMNDLRTTRIQRFNEDPEFAERRDAYRAAEVHMREELGEAPGVSEDPRYIHSDVYDDRARRSYGPRAEHQNDWIGPGGWIHINEAHMALIDAVIDRHPGERILVTFGAGHKYWFIDRLRERGDVRLLDVTSFLPTAPAPEPGG